MKLVVGLGNPGQKYKGTRHNIGFDVIASLAQRYDIGRPRSKFNAEIAETIIENEKAVIVSPLTYMNLSGQSVRAAVDFYKLPLEDLIVICDDLALDVGRLRLKPGGSAGGQKGLKDIIQRLGSPDFSRLRIGIGSPPANWETSDYVLGKFADQDRTEIEKAIVRAVKAIEVWTSQGVQTAMNQFNADPNKEQKPKSEKKSTQTNKDLPASRNAGPSESIANIDTDNKDQTNQLGLTNETNTNKNQ